MPIHGYPGGVITANPVAPTVNSATGVWTTEQQLLNQTAGRWPMTATQISRSLRFNSADTTYLNRTPASASNRKTWTWSGWVKRSLLGARNAMFTEAQSGYSTYFSLYFETDNTIAVHGVFGGTALLRQTAAVFRDVSAWYHVVIAVDTTQATDSNRILLYVNGVNYSLPTVVAGSWPTQNSDGGVNLNQPHEIGRRAIDNDMLANFYLAEVNFIDGLALTPAYFGFNNSDTGVWSPKQYTGTYGTNGFYVNFSDNSGTTSTTLGKDSSGNGNNWTPNNFSVTAGAGNDSLVDSPTSYGTDTGVGGEVRGNYCTADVLTPQGSASGLITVANGNLQLSYTSSNYAQRFGNFRVNSGKWYYEWTVTNIGYPSLQCGWFSGQAYPTFTGGAGQATGGSAVGFFGGSTLYVTTYSGGFVANTISSQTWSNGDVVMVAVDFDAGKIWFGKNGSFYSSGNPASGTNPIDTWTASSSLNFAPWFVAYGTSTDTYANFGQRPFAYTAPSGFKALCTQNLPTPTIGATSTTQANDYMNVVTYTGTGSSLGVTGVGFQPDFVWIKGRSGATDHGLYDAVRGVQKQLESNTTTVETTETTGLTAFGTDGFTVGALAQLNTSSATYVAWNWNGGGSNATNTSGTITSTVRANTTAGFSIVTYTGTSANATVGHGLGAAPSMIIIHARTGAVRVWPVYHVSRGPGGYGYLNQTNAWNTDTTGFNNTSPTSTVFSLGNNTDLNDGSNFVAYCFAPVAGYSAFGSYTGNASADGPFIYTGFRPEFIMIKASSSTGDWVMEDAARSPYNVSTNYLVANASTAEQTGQLLDFVSNGFKIRVAVSGAMNSSGVTYIYAAFAEFPFKTALAR
jgi:hypothetical protein